MRRTLSTLTFFAELSKMLATSLLLSTSLVTEKHRPQSSGIAVARSEQGAQGKPVQLAASQQRVHMSNMPRCTHRRVVSGLLGSRIREFVPRMPTVPSTPLQSDRRESLQNALGSSRVVDCLFVDNRSPMAVDTGDGLLRIDVQHNRQSTRAQLDTHSIDTPPTRPCNTSSFRCITSCFECPNPSRRTRVLISNR